VNDDYKRMLFDLTPDAHGYPPVSVEGVWVEPIVSGNFRVENVPFYVRELSCGDVVAGKADARGVLHFNGLVIPSGNSTFRVIVHDVSRLAGVRAEILEYGVDTEVDRKQHLIAIDIPSAMRIEPILNHLMRLQEVGVADFEEGALRHPLNDSVQ
jgi:hypothetical protein